MGIQLGPYDAVTVVTWVTLFINRQSVIYLQKETVLAMMRTIFWGQESK